MDASDSATMARTKYREAVAQLTKGDTVRALALLADAAGAWPLQPAYSNALLAVASRIHDQAMITTALQRAADIGVALSNSGASTLRAELSGPSLQKLLWKQDSLRAPQLRSTTRLVLNDSLLFPEGIAVDVRTGTLYVSSILHGNIFKVNATGIAQPLLNNTEHIGSVLGIVVDTLRNLMWAATIPSPLMQDTTMRGATTPSLIAISLADGHVTRRIPMPANVTNASPGDIALSSIGDVFVADAQAGILWRLKNGADTLVAIQHRLFHSLQGMVPSKDGRTVWVADYSVGLLRVDLRNLSVTRVADIAGQTTVGIDGMVSFGNSFVAVQNGNDPARVVQITLDDSGTRVRKLTVIDQHSLATSPTGGTIVGDTFVYIANSLWDGVDASGKLPATAPHPKPILLSLPLKQ